MEPHIMPLYSSSPPPLNDGGGDEAGSEDEFGDFGGFSRGASSSSSNFISSSDPQSSLRCSSVTASHQSDISSNHPVEQFKPSSTVNLVSSRGGLNVKEQDCDAESHVHLTNGYSVGGASSPGEELGFADFTVFTEQAAHPWCCGFTPSVGMEETNVVGKQICDPVHEVIMESEPRSHCKSKAGENVCTKKHCEKKDAAPVQPPQGHQQPQEAAADLDFPSEQPQSGKEDLGRPGDSFDRLSTKGMQEERESDEDGEHKEKRVTTFTKTLSICESASEASFCDDLSFDGLSADFEPNVSSLGSPEDQSDWDQTDDEEGLENFNLDSNDSNSVTSFTESNKGNGSLYVYHSAPQETSATSRSGSHTEGRFADFKRSRFELYRDQGHVQTADAEVQILGNLPPSDSFADFCSAPTHEGGQESWAEFKDPVAKEEYKTWTQSHEQVSSLQNDGSTEEGQCGQARRNSCQASLTSRVQQLLLASFPEVEVPTVTDKGVLGLGALLHDQRAPESGEEEIPKLCSRAPCIQTEMWWPHQDVHDAAGLQFQWGGSRTNQTLLKCLGVDTKNIVFMGTKKQPVTVPAFASSLGMLEPTKDSVPAVCSPRHTAVTAQASPGPQVTLGPSPDSLQEALPSSQLDWSSRGLSSSQDGTQAVLSHGNHNPKALPPSTDPGSVFLSSSTDCSALNLDYFGPGEDKTSFSSSSSSSRSNSPPPGVDRELYELTIRKLETSTSSSHMEDTLNRLLSTAERTTSSVRTLLQDEGLSEEASRVISGLPNMSFMRARVLMFPAVLVHRECGSPWLNT